MMRLLSKLDGTIATCIDLLSEYGYIGRGVMLFVTTSVLTPFIYGVDRFIGSNVEYMVVWIVLLTADSSSGIVKHYILKTLSFQDFFIKATIKTFVSFCGLVVFTSFAVTFDVGGYAEEYLIMFGRISVSVYIGESALVNLYIITNKRFPPVAFMERLKMFKDSGDTKDITNP